MKRIATPQPFQIIGAFLVCLQKNYEKFDGFVVLHGTDTMAYTASALSFMCEDLGKPIILTGSQVRVSPQRSH